MWMAINHEKNEILLFFGDAPAFVYLQKMLEGINNIEVLKVDTIDKLENTMYEYKDYLVKIVRSARNFIKAVIDWL